MAEHLLLVEQTRTTEEIDRRRPGRAAYANPHLVALLRQTTSEAAPPEQRAMAETDALGPARGMLVGSAAGIVIWGGIALLLVAFGVL